MNSAEIYPQLTPEAVLALLQRQKLPVVIESVQSAFERLSKEGILDGQSPGVVVQKVLALCARQPLSVTQTSGLEWDRRAVPSLLWEGSRWLVADRIDDELVLFDTAGTPLDAGTPIPDHARVLHLQKAAPPQAKDEHDLRQSPSARMVWVEMMRNRRWVVEVTAATIAVNVFAIFTSLFSMQVYDRVVPTFAYTTLWALTTGLLLVSVIDWAFKEIRSRIIDRLSCDVDKAVSQRIYDHLLRLRADKRPQSLGTLAAQVNSLDTVRQFFASAVIFTIVDLPFGLLFLVMIGMIAGWLASVYIIASALLLLLGLIAQRQLAELSRTEMRRSHERQGMLVDTLQGVETIQSLNAGWRFSRLWSDLTRNIAETGMKNKVVTSAVLNLAGTIANLAYVALIVAGVYLIEEGSLTMGGLVACSMLGSRVISPITAAVQKLTQWQYVKEALQMVDKILSLETDRPAGQTLLAPATLEPSVELEGVRFAYQGVPVLRLNVPTLKVKAGDRIVILGANGGGKSTLLKVAAGLYRASEGQVRIGGVEIGQIDPGLLSKQLGYLPQDVHLFKGTLRSNIELRGGESDERFIDVVKMLGLDRIAADNPKNLDLEIAEGGQGLSGGQRQMVGIARLMMARPQIWLLDEPSSALDAEAEARLIQALRTVLRPTDILIIASHRPQMLALATRVIVMQRGMIAADGTPQAVLAPPKMVNPAATAAATAQTAPAVVQVPKEVSHGHHILRQHA
jgi:ATP-binding cassette subfamily C protein LapB